MSKYVGYVVDVWVLLLVALMLVAVVEMIRALGRKEEHPHDGLLMMTLVRVLCIVLFWPVTTVLYVGGRALTYAVGAPLIGAILIWQKIIGRLQRSNAGDARIGNDESQQIETSRKAVTPAPLDDRRQPGEVRRLHART
jgi:hypothetical protein